MDNLWITFRSVIFWLAEAESERGGGCIIGVLDNDIDSHLQILKKARQNTLLVMPLESLKTGLEQAFTPRLYLTLRNQINRSEVCIQLPIKPQRIQ